jgi:tRNA threonylcarbamoyl adenosine modification protein YjeE
MKIVCESQKNLFSCVKQMFDNCGDPNIWLFSGDLGAGKTTMIKILSSFYGVEVEDVHSPSFSLVHEYESSQRRVFHTDLYRLCSLQNIDELGFYTPLLEDNAVLFVEWAQKFSFDYWKAMHLPIIHVLIDIPDFESMPEKRIYTLSYL